LKIDKILEREACDSDDKHEDNRRIFEEKAGEESGLLEIRSQVFLPEIMYKVI
jgi:hypothetical protein